MKVWQEETNKMNEIHKYISPPCTESMAVLAIVINCTKFRVGIFKDSRLATMGYFWALPYGKHVTPL